MRTIESPVGAQIVLDGREYINFGGSSYFGITSVPEILDAGVAALRSNGSGYQFANQYQISTAAHQDVEAAAVMFFDTSAALYLPNGYSFGLVSFAAVRSGISSIFFDEWTHSCLREAIAASGLPSFSYRHLDSQDLESKLKRHVLANGRPLVVTDGMYSTFGEIAPLDQLAQIMAPYDGRLLIDESHSFGVLGDQGRGAVEHYGLSRSSILVGGSTSKAFGVLGGIIPASEEQVAACRAAPASRGSTVGLAAAAAMCARSFRYVRQHPELLMHLRQNTSYAKTAFRKLGLDVGDSIAPVATFAAGSFDSTRCLQQRLMEDGIFVMHSNYVGAGSAGVIRCGIFADHTQEHIDHLVHALRRYI